MIEGKSASAYSLARRALDLKPDSERAAGVLVESAPKETPWDDVQKELSSDLQQHPELLIALAERAFNQREEKAANRLLKSAIKRDPDNWMILARAGLIRFAKVSEKNEIRFLRMLREADRQVVKEASDLFDRAWSAIKSTGWPPQGDWVAANRASTLLLLSDEGAADTVLQEAIARCGTTPSLLHVRAMRHMDRGQWPEALADLGAIPEAYMDNNDRLMLIQAEVRGGGPQAL